MIGDVRRVLDERFAQLAAHTDPILDGGTTFSASRLQKRVGVLVLEVFVDGSKRFARSSTTPLRRTRAWRSCTPSTPHTCRTLQSPHLIEGTGLVSRRKQRTPSSHEKLVPAAGFELAAARLQIECSTN